MQVATIDDATPVGLAEMVIDEIWKSKMEMFAKQPTGRVTRAKFEVNIIILHLLWTHDLRSEIKLLQLIYKSCIRRKEFALANGAFLNGGDFASFFVRFSASPRGAPRDYDRAPRERRVSPTSAAQRQTKRASQSNSLTSFQTNVQYRF